MHAIAGFESQIRARSAALSMIEAALGRGFVVRGAALARLDSERAIHVDPLRGYAMPEHVLKTIDDFVGGAGAELRLEPGETAAVVAIAVSPDHDGAPFDEAFVGSLEARWFTVTASSPLSSHA